MRRILGIVLSAAFFSSGGGLLAQFANVNVSNASELSAALAQAYANSLADPLATNTITLTANISATGQMIVNANLNIVGGGFTLDMNNADRAFFIAGGNVSIANLTIQNGNATGGAGGNGGGGGAGLGGAIFVGSGTYSAWDGSAGAAGLSAPAVTLSGVSFQNNQAVGGSSPIVQKPDGGAAAGGGGGGMGGAGGSTVDFPFGQGSGGGGFGNGAIGGYFTVIDSNQTLISAGAGALANVSGTNTSGGFGGPGATAAGYPGGINGGGGGSGSPSGDGGAGGGGGIGGGRGYFQNNTTPNNGGYGGFGGGGGGSTLFSGGNGGFGGGGGAGLSTGAGGLGGFGGGGGGIDEGSGTGGAGGFGAGHGANEEGNGGGGGGGLGAGGAVFVMAGASVTVVDGGFSGSSVTAGTGYYSGSAYGTDLFLGADVTFNVSSALTVNSLGGAGNLADPNVATKASDPNAQGGVVKTGNGTLTLTGTSFYTGNTTVKSGTLALGPGAQETGTALVTVGQTAGDNGTLLLGANSLLSLAGFAPTTGTDVPVMIAQSAGSTGAVVIGGGAGTSGAAIAARTFTGGAGTATVTFTQQYAVNSTTDSVYPFYTVLTGSVGVVQAGVGTTSLQPRAGANTFTGPILVESGTLQIGSATALPGGNALTLDGGTLQTALSLDLTFGAGTVTAASTIDLAGNSSVTFSTLGVSAPLAVWNYTPGDTISVLTGTVAGGASQILFYSDNGQTFLGTGAFSPDDVINIVPVPEPSVLALGLLAGLTALGLVAYRGTARRRGAPASRR